MNILAQCFLFSMLIYIIHSQSLYLSTTECTLYYSSYSNSVFSFHNCTSTDINSTSWTSCISQCCVSATINRYPYPTISAISFCEENDIDQSTVTIIKIIVGVVIGVNIVAVLIGLFRYHCRTRREVI